VYQQIEGFGEYGFPESHAASFGLLVYTSAWLKHHYPATFATAMINSQPMGFYQPAQLVRDARDHGVAVRPVDVNFSNWDCTLEEEENCKMQIAKCKLQIAKDRSSAMNDLQFEIGNLQSPILRLGLRMIGGLREAHGKLIEQIRARGPFMSIDDFAHRTALGQAVIKRLAEADAFGSVGASRRQSLWHAMGQEKKRRAMPLFEVLPLPPEEVRAKGARMPQIAYQSVLKSTAGQASSGTQEPFDPLPPMPLYEEVVADYRTAGLSLRAHPISFYRDQLERLGVTPARQLVELKNDAPVRVAGLVLLRQRPGTAKGITFVMLEDETGTVNLVVHQHTWDRFYRIARRAPAWIAHGHIQTTTESFAPVIHVVVARLEALTEQLQRLDVKSRDFR
jgi:error-prone DNA polymerase